MQFFNIEISTWVMVIGIFVALAIGLVSIRQIKDAQQREFRLRLLNEVIDWGIDIRKNIPDLTSLLEEFDGKLTNATKPEDNHLIGWTPNDRVSELTMTHIHVSRCVTPLVEIQVRNEYIKQIASIFQNDLSGVVETLANDLTQHVRLLEECLDFLDRRASNEEIVLAIRCANEHDDQIVESTIKALEKATQNKTRMMA